ncbi:MAG: MFS transporter [Gammaproteobacteria bacterium]|nr:MAG: MFS transporter [Gammaproteobacteria bacterium]
MTRASKELLTRLYDLATGDEDARVCRDIPDDACRHQPRNYFAHIVALIATKAGDLLMDVKTVLAWILATLGAPAVMIAMLVPIRESLSLLPQLAVAGVMRRYRLRKWFWVAGSVVQGVAVLAMVPVVLAFEGAVAGGLILALLVVFALARGVCSVSLKDVEGKTVSKTRRGSVSGYASSAAGVVSLLVGGWLHFGGTESQSLAVFAWLLIGAGVLWLFAAVVYAQVLEPEGATEGGASALAEAWRSLRLLREDARLRHFLYVRTLLLSTALTAPFYVVLTRELTDSSIGALGLMIIATGLASLLSSAVWGRLADRSSRWVLVAAAVIAGTAGILAFGYGRVDTTHSAAVFAMLFFVLGVAHSGVRIGRKTYLVDMADQSTRAAYVALSNTLIGIALLLASTVGLLGGPLGAGGLILLLALVSLAAAALAVRLPEVQ